MNRVIVPACATMLGLASVATPAWAQADRATQDLINRLSFSDRSRGIIIPQAPRAAPTVAPAPMANPVEAPRPTAPRLAAVRPTTTSPPTVAASGGAPSAISPTTTAPEGVPAVSITVNFASGSATLAPGAVSQLDILGRALVSERLARDRFRIEGHTDTVGPAEENHLLSERRAAAVRNYLMERFSISGDRLVTAGMGESRLLVPTPDETANARNRRVQVLNLGS